MKEIAINFIFHLNDMKKFDSVVNDNLKSILIHAVSVLNNYRNGCKNDIYDFRKLFHNYKLQHNITDNKIITKEICTILRKISYINFKSIKESKSGIDVFDVLNKTLNTYHLLGVYKRYNYDDIELIFNEFSNGNDVFDCSKLEDLSKQNDINNIINKFKKNEFFLSININSIDDSYFYWSKKLTYSQYLNDIHYLYHNEMINYNKWINIIYLYHTSPDVKISAFLEISKNNQNSFKKYILFLSLMQDLNNFKKAIEFNPFGWDAECIIRIKNSYNDIFSPCTDELYGSYHKKYIYKYNFTKISFRELKKKKLNLHKKIRRSNLKYIKKLKNKFMKLYGEVSDFDLNITNKNTVKMKNDINEMYNFYSESVKLDLGPIEYENKCKEYSQLINEIESILNRMDKNYRVYADLATRLCAGLDDEWA